MAGDPFVDATKSARRWQQRRRSSDQGIHPREIVGQPCGDRSHRDGLFIGGTSVHRAPRHPSRHRQRLPSPLGCSLERGIRSALGGEHDAVQDRLLERRRRRQRLPRGAGLHGEGPGQGVRPGLRAGREASQHRRRGPGLRHPEPDRGGRQGDHLQPERQGGPQPGAPGGQGRRASRRSSVDAYVTDPDTYNLYNNQVKYAELGAKWLFDQLGGTGTVWYTRGLAGHPADTDRDIGFKNVLKDYPNIKVVPSPDGVATGWDPAKATQLTNDFISSGQYDKIQGIWASGMGKQIVDAIKARPRSRSCRSPTPTSVASSPSSSTRSSSRASRARP